METNKLTRMLEKTSNEKYQQMLDLVKDTGFIIEGIKGVDFHVSDGVTIWIMKIEHRDEDSDYNKDQELIEKRLEDFEDEGNPEPSVIWFFGTGIITITGYM